MRDLCPGRGYELVEEPCDELPIRLVETCERALEVLLDDSAGTTQVRQGFRAQNQGAATALDLPEPLHHELEIRRLHPASAPAAHHDSAAREPPLDPT